MIHIFNKIIFGDDALDFISWSKSDQKEWIKKNTNQKSDELIDEFLNNPKIGKDAQCLNCGKLNDIIVKHETIVNDGDNIGETDVIEDANSIESDMVKGQSSGNSTKRSEKIKGRKNK